jgi:hypothetical protein
MNAHLLRRTPVHAYQSRTQIGCKIVALSKVERSSVFFKVNKKKKQKQKQKQRKKDKEKKKTLKYAAFNEQL